MFKVRDWNKCLINESKTKVLVCCHERSQSHIINEEPQVPTLPPNNTTRPVFPRFLISSALQSGQGPFVLRPQKLYSVKGIASCSTRYHTIQTILRVARFDPCGKLALLADDDERRVENPGVAQEDRTKVMGTVAVSERATVVESKAVSVIEPEIVSVWQQVWKSHGGVLMNMGVSDEKRKKKRKRNQPKSLQELLL